MTQSRTEIETQIENLEQQLREAKAKLQHQTANGVTLNGASELQPHFPQLSITTSPSSLHTLLLLADSALPLGSFAFSAGLESYLAHHRVPAAQQHGLLRTFLSHSLLSLASTSLPYMLAAWRDTSRLEELDNAFDASTVCTVARRASVSQGRALVGVWERSFRSAVNTTQHGKDAEAMNELRTFGRTFKLQPTVATSLTGSPFEKGYMLNAHLGPLWGVVTRAFSVDEESAAYLYLFSHARTVVSAAVRAGVLGPYQAQAELASIDLRHCIEKLVKEWWNTVPEDAGQVVPVMDLWVGRHEKLYSRIFNS
jgi:urease accessory protein